MCYIETQVAIVELAQEVAGVEEAMGEVDAPDCEVAEIVQRLRAAIDAIADDPPPLPIPVFVSTPTALVTVKLPSGGYELRFMEVDY